MPDHAYVVIAGSAMGNGHITSDTTREPNDYIASIVYGDPRITAVVVGRSFVALCQYPMEDAAAAYTHQRMGSFAYGSKMLLHEDTAHEEFGRMIASLAPTLR